MTEAGRWLAVVAFAVLVSLAYISFALAFRQMGGAVAWNVRYLFALALQPLFLAGLALSFTSTFVRMALFQSAGVARTVLLSELSVVVMLLLSLLVFRERFGPKEVGGSLLVLAGILLVGR